MEEEEEGAGKRKNVSMHDKEGKGKEGKRKEEGG